MSFFTDLIDSGAREFVAGFAREAVKIARGEIPKPARSPLSRAIAKIRKRWPELAFGTSGYERARRVFNQQLTRAFNAQKAIDEYLAGRIADDEPLIPDRRAEPGEMVTRVYHVEIVSPREATRRWVTVEITHDANASMADIRELAKGAVLDQNANYPQSRIGRTRPNDNWTIATIHPIG